MTLIFEHVDPDEDMLLVTHDEKFPIPFLYFRVSTDGGSGTTELDADTVGKLIDALEKWRGGL
jgi:hypothetical protein